MAESDRTALNTSEYRYYSYFQRVRERLDRAWVPMLKDKLTSFYRAGRHLASDRDYTTKLLVVLNASGEIVRVLLLEPSGTYALDDTAIAAFNRAGPFPNPPKGMVDLNQEVRVPWDFILKT
jgi:protein TonB